MEVLRERKRGPSNDRFYGWYASMWAKSQYSCVCFFYSHVSFSSFGASTSGSSVWMWMGPLTSWPAHASFIAPMSPPPSPPVCSPMLKQVHHPVPPSSPPMSPSYIPLSSQCELNTSVLLFMFLLLMYLFFFSWCSNIWLFCLDVDGGSTDQLTSHDNQLPLPSSKLSLYQALSHAIWSICLLRMRLPTMIHLCWWGLWAGLEWIRQFDWPEVGFVRWGWGVNNVTVVGVKSINMIVLSLPPCSVPSIV